MQAGSIPAAIRDNLLDCYSKGECTMAYEFNHYYELQNVSTEKYVNLLGNHENGTVKNRERVRSSM